jgi:hypothetical protein
MPVNPRREMLRRGRQLREQFRQRTEPFFQCDFREALAVRCRDLTAAAYDGCIDGVAEQLDRDSTGHGRKDDEQPDLPGWDLDGEYRLGDGKRIAKKHARLEHIEAALALSDHNLVAVQRANLRDREELIRLRPYLGPGVTKQQAIEAYRADHPAEDQS